MYWVATRLGIPVPERVIEFIAAWRDWDRTPQWFDCGRPRLDIPYSYPCSIADLSEYAEPGYVYYSDWSLVGVV